MKRNALWLAAALVSGLFIGAVPLGKSPLYTQVLTPHVLVVVSSACKLLSLGGGALFAARALRSFDPKTATRAGWSLMCVWFCCFFVGQLVLTYYELRTGSAPVPSIGDPFFFLGYAAVIIATVRFIAGYRASGFAVGATRGHVMSALVAVVVVLWIGLLVLRPAFHGDAPLATRLVNVGYPALDLVLLVPTVVGRLWSVWATLLIGVLFFTSGDVLFAIPGPITTWLAPVSDLCFLLGYGFAAAGAGLEGTLLDG